MRDIKIAWGLLGWSNKRTGIEFYRWDEKVIPRHKSEWGDLLAKEHEINNAEGCPIIVVVFDRSAKVGDLIAATSAIQGALSSAGSGGNTEETT